MLTVKDLKKAMTAASLTQTAMAERTGIAQGQISLILAGKVDPRLSTWVRLVRAVGVRP